MSEREAVASEPDGMVDRYARRVGRVSSWTYDPLNPAVYMAVQERERALIRLIAHAKLAPLADRTAIEIGCGSGGNLLELIKLGFRPENLVGNELLPERFATARQRLPESVRLFPGDANVLALTAASFDVVFQSTVFTSILDRKCQARLAKRMWSWVKPGGGVLWYDFAFNNPRNADVRGIQLRRIRDLFPESEIRSWRVTVAPPLGRAVTRIHPALYSVFRSIGVLRTHLLCWIPKALSGS